MPGDLLQNLSKLQSLYHDYFMLVQEQGKAIQNGEQTTLRGINSGINQKMFDINEFQNESQVIVRANEILDKIKPDSDAEITEDEQKTIAAYAAIVQIIKSIQLQLAQNIEQQKIAVEKFKSESEGLLKDLESAYQAANKNNDPDPAE